MSKPTKFDLMRRQRRNVERRRTLDEHHELREEARAFGYDHSDEVVRELLANDRINVNRARRWWWPFARSK